jgi:hypothetical protein
MERRELTQEYAKHNVRSDNLPQDAIHPLKERRVTCQNKLILLLPTNKIRVDGQIRTNRTVNFKYMRRRTRHRAINKVEDTLTKKIWLHLHSPIEIIVVRKLQRNNLLSVAQSNYC